MRDEFSILRQVCSGGDVVADMAHAVKLQAAAEVTPEPPRTFKIEYAESPEVESYRAIKYSGVATPPAAVSIMPHGEDCVCPECIAKRKDEILRAKGRTWPPPGIGPAPTCNCPACVRGRQEMAEREQRKYFDPQDAMASARELAKMEARSVFNESDRPAAADVVQLRLVMWPGGEWRLIARIEHGELTLARGRGVQNYAANPGTTDVTMQFELQESTVEANSLSELLLRLDQLRSLAGRSTPSVPYGGGPPADPPGKERFNRVVG